MTQYGIPTKKHLPVALSQHSCPSCESPIREAKFHHGPRDAWARACNLTQWKGVESAH